MTDLLVLFGFFLADMVFSFSGIFLFLLLLFPPYLFVRGYPSGMILFGGGGAVFLGELLHQHTLGSYMLGVGIALFVFHFFLDVINWHHFLPQVTCLLFYFVIILVTRVLLGRILHGQWIVLQVLPFLWTYLVGVAFIVIRLNRGRGVGSRSTGSDAI
jgi:hypothetical protein